MIITAILSLSLATQASAPPTSIPQGALARENPKLRWVSFDVTINTIDIPNNDRPLRMPLIVNGPWSEMSTQSIRVESSSGNKSVSILAGDQATNGSGGLGESMVRASVPLGPSRFSTVSISAEIVSWSSTVNEQQAAATAWPAQWPGDAAKALQPQALIESNDLIFKETIDSIFGQNLRMTSPWIVAKVLTKYACENVRVSGSRLLGNRSNMRGLNVQGALETARTGNGSRADLTCVSVALLRAAGIPARPVIGLDDQIGNGKELTTWAEFYLPGSGWVPFSPWQLQNAGVRSWKPDRSWRYFGNWNELNDQVPLSWSFAPGDGTTAHDAWAIWGWTRAINGTAFPLPDRYVRKDGDSDQLLAEFKPSSISIQFVSGGGLGDRELAAWREGTRRPIRRRKDAP